MASWLAARPEAIHRAVQGFALVVLIFACARNFEKPTTIWAATDWGRARNFHSRGYVGRGAAKLGNLVPAGASVGLLTTKDGWTFSYLPRRPDVRFVPLNWCNVTGRTPGGRLDYLLCVGSPCTVEGERFSARTLWAAGFAPREPAGALLALERYDLPGPTCVRSAASSTR